LPPCRPLDKDHRPAMLGPEKGRDLDCPILTSLEALVPPTNFYRHLDATLDLSFARDWVKGCYAVNGRPSIDPVVFFRLQLIMFFEGLRSERQLIEQANINLAHRWYLGYRLDEELPDHSSLTRLRQRFGRPIFRRFFEHIVDLCQEAGLIWGKELLFDATKVRANAALDSLQPRLREVTREHVAALFAADAAASVDATAAPADAAEEVPAASRALPLSSAVAPDDAARAWDLLEACRLDPERPRVGSYQRQSDLLVSAIDPDATPMRSTGEHASLGYHDHYCVDGGRARIILQALVTPADVMENEPMLPMLQRPLPLASAPQAGDRGPGAPGALRHDRQYPRAGGRGRPRLRAAGELGGHPLGAHALLRPLAIHLRRRARRVPLS
jgi:transposase